MRGAMKRLDRCAARANPVTNAKTRCGILREELAPSVLLVAQIGGCEKVTYHTLKCIKKQSYTLHEFLSYAQIVSVSLNVRAVRNGQLKI